MSNRSVVRLSAGQRDASKQEGIKNIKDLVEFEDGTINNVIQNLRQSQDIWHPIIPTHAGSVEIATDVNNSVLLQAKVA